MALTLIIVTPPLLSFLLLILILLLSRRGEIYLLSESSAFECGIDPNSNSRIPFSIRFFLLAVLFLIFDVETVLLLGLPTMNGLPLTSIIVIGLFILLLGIGLAHELREQTLSWAV